MLTIALETSHRAASVAIQVDGELTEVHLDPGQAHASDCLALISSWFHERDLSPLGIDRVLVGTGPGSYTGLRIGIATALGLARGADAGARGVPSGQALCWRELKVGEEAIHLLDARQGELYFAHYLRQENDVQAITEACVLRIDELARALPENLPIFGDQKALELAQLDEVAGSRFRDVPAPNAGALMQLGSQRMDANGPQSFEAIEPLYLRPFAAKVRKR